MTGAAAAADYDPSAYGVSATIRGLFGVWSEQRRLSAIALGLAFVYSALSTVIPILIARVIDGSILHDQRPLTPQLALIAALAAVRSVINFVRRYATARFGIRVEARLRELLYYAYLRFPRAFYDRHPTGQVVSRATNDLYPVRYFLGWGLVQGVQAAMMVIGAGIVLVLVDPLLALYSAAPLPFLAVVAWRFGHRVTPISREVQRRKGDVTESANEAVVGIEMVQAFGRERDVQRRFAGHAGGLRSEYLRQAGVEATHMPTMFYLPSLSVAAVLWMGGHAVIDGTLSYGELALFIQLLLQLVWPLQSIGIILNLGQRALAAAGRTFPWLDQVPELPEPARPLRLARSPFSLTMKDVRFAHPGGAEVLRGVTLDVVPGEVLAVCGATGAGKSTLLTLVARFHNPTAGAVLLGGSDLRDMSLGDVRGAVAVATQRPVLFSESLLDNVRAGRPDAPWEAVKAVCDAAGVSAFVPDLTDGWNTVIGERGANLSGGQRQRVALARALLPAAPVVVLDDPLSAVDMQTEARIVRRLRPLLAGTAVLVATQRMSTLMLADRVAVLQDGTIVETGTPAKLLASGGAFVGLFGEDAVAA